MAVRRGAREETKAGNEVSDDERLSITTSRGTARGPFPSPSSSPCHQYSPNAWGICEGQGASLHAARTIFDRLIISRHLVEISCMQLEDPQRSVLARYSKL